MAYVLTRLFIAAVGCGCTCAVMSMTWPHLDAADFFSAGAAWIAILTIYLAGMQKLRREFQGLRSAGAVPASATLGAPRRCPA